MQHQPLVTAYRANQHLSKTTAYEPNHDYGILSPGFKPAVHGQKETLASSTYPTLVISCEPLPNVTTSSACVLVNGGGPTKTTSMQSMRNMDLDHDNSIIAQASTPSTIQVHFSKFPPLSFQAFGYLHLEPMLHLPFAQYPVSHFPKYELEKMWDKFTIKLNPYLMPTKYHGPDKCQTPMPTLFHYEHKFAGYAFHVKFNATRCKKKIVFNHGTAVDIMEIDEYDGRYIIDYCQLIRDGIAYLPVHYREYENQAFSAANDPRHYSFILTVSVELSKAPFLPHLLPYMANHDIVHVAASKRLSIPTKQLA